jgi:membrane-bound lytic murein transglycosylase D
VGLYNRWCTSGPRAELARTLVLSDPSRAVVRTGPLQAIPSDDVQDDAAAGQGATVATLSLAAAPAPAAPKPARRDYRVQEGESLSTIAKKFRCEVDALAKANDLKRTQKLKRGQVLRLDGCDG